MLHKPDQPTMLEFVEGPHETLPTTKTCQSRSPSLAHIIRLREKHCLSLGYGVTRASYI
jgi:hypothetical protein